MITDDSRLGWACAHYKIKDLPFSLKDALYMLGIYNDEHSDIRIEKASQCYFTEWAIVDTIYNCIRNNLNIAYYLPTDNIAKDFSKDRINSAIAQSEYIQKLTTINDVHLKHIGKGSIYVRGCKITQAKGQREIEPSAPTSVISIPIDVLILDEKDFMDDNIISLIEKRLGASKFKYKRYLSTPTIPGRGIDKDYNESDKRQWFIKCSHCSKKQVPTFPDNINFEKQEFICIKCKRPTNRFVNGEWVAEFPKRDIHGYQISRLVNPRATISEIVAESLKTSESEIQTFYNFTLGLARNPKGMRFDKDLILGCRQEDYLMPVNSTEMTVAGIDVGTLFHIRINKLEGGKQKAVYIGAVKHFDDLVAILRRYNAGLIVIDAMPETRVAKDLSDTFKGKVWLAYFPAQKDLWVKSDVDGYKSINIHRTQMMDLVIADFTNRNFILPTNVDSMPDYITHILAMTRILRKDQNNNDVPYWLSSGPDHYFLAEVYCKTAQLLYEKRSPIILRVME